MLLSAFAPQLANVARDVLGGPVGKVVGGVINELRPGGLLGIAGPLTVVGQIGIAFKELFGRDKNVDSHHHACPARPEPFPPPFANPYPQLAGINRQLQQISNKLDQMIGKLDQSIQPGEGPSPQQGGMNIQDVISALKELLGKLTGAGDGVTTPSTGDRGGMAYPGGSPDFYAKNPPRGFDGGNKIDSMMAQAKNLMMSESKQHQLMGQEMMQNAQNMFNMMSQMIKAQGDMSRASIQNLR